jgi:nucleotide-binding universal stress UspA family protein
MTKEHVMTDRPVIVVGYDGTRASRAAVALGAERVNGGGRLLVVRAYQLPPDEDELGAFHAARLEDAADVAAQCIDVLVDAEPRLAFVDWERHVLEGPPAEVLCRVAARHDADELIIGTRGLGRRTAFALGSVAAEVLHRADRPVTVIPDRMLVQEPAR